MQKYFSTFVLACVFIAGLLTFNQYGESWDDRSLQKYADLSMQAYTTFPQQGFVEVDPQNLGYYGPFFVSFAALASQFLNTVLPVSLPDLRHLIYFLTWFAGILAFHSLAKRWLTQLPALGATLLFVSQPLLWGHAFINPKDTPFLALFLLSLSVGMHAFDSLKSDTPIDLAPRSKRTLALLTTFWLVSVFSLFIFTESIHAYIETLVLSARSGNTNLLTFIAKDITGVAAEIYIQRYFVLFLQVRTIYLLLFTLILLIVWYRLNPQLPVTLFTILPAAILLGLTTSTRILGPFAGLLVVVYALRTKGGKQALSAIAMYAVVAMIACYLTWPYLWMNPVLRFWDSFIEMSSYPWFGEVLFNGGTYSATDLPFSYLPVLLTIQLTEPVWLLSLAGWLVSVFDKEKKRGLIELSLLWFVIPLIVFIILRVALYDNFRQILFILPPIFLMAGIAFERIKNVKWQAGLIVASLLPGLIGIISLHPYEYIYYNSFVGGVGNVQGRFETDYWLTSYREAAEYLNEIASDDDLIWVEGPGHLYSIFSENEVNVYSWSRETAPAPYDYMVITTRYDFDKTFYPNAKIIHRITRGGAVLAVIKKP